MTPDWPLASLDVIVVGCGVAGLSAAVAAAEAGAKVAVLERSTFEERGGNTRYTTAAIRMKSEEAVADDFEQRFIDNSGYHVAPDLIEATVLDFDNWPGHVRTAAFTSPDLIAFFAEQSPPTIAWLKSQGVHFGGIGFYGLTARSSPRIAISGGGLHLVEVMTERAVALGAQFFYETCARDLIRGEAGGVAGVVARGRDDKPLTLRAAAVVLACGGFEGNPEMVARYIGPKGRYLRPVARGGYYNKGEGIAMALGLGAAPAGDFSEYHAQPIDPRSSATEPIVMMFPYGVLLNREGRRFVNEAPGPIDASYEDISRRIAEQPDGIAFCVLDTRIETISNWQRCVRSDVPPERASDLRALGRTLGFDGAEAERTIAAYNTACPVDGRFDPTVLDAVASGNLYPAKSNYAVPLDRPPYVVFPVISSNTFTFGGLKVNVNAQVLNTDGDAMPGLYAAGETVGIYYGRYPGATSVLRGAVFGRQAGLTAAQARTERSI
jgi:tricarballylate dehydrogenase